MKVSGMTRLNTAEYKFILIVVFLNFNLLLLLYGIWLSIYTVGSGLQFDIVIKNARGCERLYNVLKIEGSWNSITLLFIPPPPPPYLCDFIIITSQHRLAGSSNHNKVLDILFIELKSSFNRTLSAKQHYSYIV